jgi:hypothetical protein
MNPYTQHLLCLICLRVLADTTYDGRWIAYKSDPQMAKRLRLLGIARSETRPGWETLKTQGLVEYDDTRVRLTPLGYLQSQMPYTPRRPACTWYEEVVEHLYGIPRTPAKEPAR